jgi:hypothetical protein
MKNPNPSSLSGELPLPKLYSAKTGKLMFIKLLPDDPPVLLFDDSRLNPNPK